MLAHRERGQSAVELALLLPILLLIVLGCLDLSRAFQARMALANGTREGARYASLHPNADPMIVRQRTEADILAQGLEASDLRVFPPVAPEGLKGGKPIRVTAEYTLPVLTSYLFGGQPLRIAASTEMIILGGE